MFHSLTKSQALVFYKYATRQCTYKTTNTTRARSARFQGGRSILHLKVNTAYIAFSTTSGHLKQPTNVKGTGSGTTLFLSFSIESHFSPYASSVRFLNHAEAKIQVTNIVQHSQKEKLSEH